MVVSDWNWAEFDCKTNGADDGADADGVDANDGAAAAEGATGDDGADGDDCGDGGNDDDDADDDDVLSIFGFISCPRK